jgi:anaerobic selenocysteine-containing dehydrogenase
LPRILELPKIEAAKTVKSTCFFCSSVSCGVNVHLDEKGKVIGIYSDPESPVNAGANCPRVGPWNPTFGVEYVYNKDRVNFPMKRVGERGANKWEQITWDQALDEIAARLKEIIAKYGPEAIATSRGTGRTSNDWGRRRFTNLLGTPNNIGIDMLCFGPSALADSFTYGYWSMMYVIPKMTKCLLYIGGQASADSTPVSWEHTKTVLDKGCKLIVADPRFTSTASMADIWIQHRPGTDGALLLSMLNVIVTENLYKKEFVEKYTNASHLVRTDTQKALRESDLAEGGSESRFVVWDSSKSKPAIYDPDTLGYSPKETTPATKGVYEVSLKDGSKVECKTVWDLFVERIEKHTPAWAAKIMWEKPEKIVEAARIYATHHPAASHHGKAPESLGRGGFQALRAKAILKAICDNLDVEGGEVMTGPHPKFIPYRPLELNEYLTAEQKAKQIGADRFKVLSNPGFEEVCKAVTKVWGNDNWPPANHTNEASAPLVYRAMITGKPYPVRALIALASNPLVAHGNTKLIHQAIKSLDLFVVMDPMWNVSARLADYVLPAASWLEEGRASHPAGWGIANAVSAGLAAVPRKVEGEYDRYSDYEFWRGLALRMGQSEELWPWETVEQTLDHRFKAFGMTLEEFVEKKRFDTWPIEFRKYERTGFATPTGKVELWSITMEKLGYDPLPNYEEPAESPYSTPILAKKYPLILTTGGRFIPMHHSEFRQLKIARRMHPDPVVTINDDDARVLGIYDRDWVWIETARGRIRQRAQVTPSIKKGVVHAEHGWTLPELPGEEPILHGLFEYNANVLVDDDPDKCGKETGTWSTQAMLCKVYPVEQT